MKESAVPRLALNHLLSSSEQQAKSTVEREWRPGTRGCPNCASLCALFSTPCRTLWQQSYSWLTKPLPCWPVCSSLCYFPPCLSVDSCQTSEATSPRWLLPRAEDSRASAHSVRLPSLPFRRVECVPMGSSWRGLCYQTCLQINTCEREIH